MVRKYRAAYLRWYWNAMSRHINAWGQRDFWVVELAVHLQFDFSRPVCAVHWSEYPEVFVRTIPEPNQKLAFISSVPKPETITNRYCFLPVVLIQDLWTQYTRCLWSVSFYCMWLNEHRVLFQRLKRIPANREVEYAVTIACRIRCVRPSLHRWHRRLGCVCRRGRSVEFYRVGTIVAMVSVVACVANDCVCDAKAVESVCVANDCDHDDDPLIVPFYHAMDSNDVPCPGTYFFL